MLRKSLVGEVVYDRALEGLFLHGLKASFTPGLKDGLRALGVDLDRPLPPTLPRATWNELIRLSAEALAEGRQPIERAYHELGRRLAHGFVATVAGRALLGLVRFGGPQVAIQRTEQNLRAGCSYAVARISQLTASSGDVWINEPDIHPECVAGILEASAELAGARRAEVTLLERDRAGCTYRVRWER